jgi:hypothetical protein
MTFQGKQKLKELVLSRPIALQEMIEEVLQKEEKIYRLETQVYKKEGRALWNE